jgi:hypothetical protein
MELHDRRSLRQLIGCLAVPAGLALMIALAPSRATAQGTREQRAACEDEARWLCSNYIPDENAITACMVRNRSALSRRCRAMLGSDSNRGSGAKQRK